MKSEFEKLAKGVSSEEIQSFLRLQRRVLDALIMYRRNTLSFIQSKYRINALADAILKEVADMPDDRKEAARGSIKFILGNVKKKFEMELSEVRRSGNRHLYFDNQYSLPYQNRLTSRVNRTIRAEAVVPIVNAIMGAMDPEITPKIDEEIQKSRSVYANNIYARDAFIDANKKISSALYLYPDDVYEFLWDKAPEGSKYTIVMNKFDVIADEILKMDDEENNLFYEFFDNYMDEVKKHFTSLANKYVAAGKLTHSIDDDRWFDFADQINSAMEEVSIDITMIGIRLLKLQAIENSPGAPTI